MSLVRKGGKPSEKRPWEIGIGSDGSCNAVSGKMGSEIGSSVIRGGKKRTAIPVEEAIAQACSSKPKWPSYGASAWVSDSNSFSPEWVNSSKGSEGV